MGRLSASCSREEVTSRASWQGPGSGGLRPAPGAPRLPTSPEARLLERAVEDAKTDKGGFFPPPPTSL